MTIRVGVADWRVTDDDDAVLVTSGLGSCVAIAVRDARSGAGGLLHAMLPEADGPVDTPAKYVDSGLDEMVSALLRLGASPSTLTAKLAGGSTMLDLSIGDSVGSRNVSAAERALADADIELLASETGGDSGRSVSFSPSSGDVTIDRVDAEVHVI
ncbi:chemotaxis protein CheD [Halobacterium salinarum]|nr:chemotaxis protein CheD [Halobacterium salinarum]MBB6090504.1 chemotaxis protein CheD [Halobacterium salinarum]MDL0131974.1 chemotaxis protein CheD [Halobacterium salinarum]MDL0141267.1 chemotaxis protein CheD [Halobacterium salinarum]UEB92811.1 chemotaxis protein CheD [Halobacterium salinarum NRC-34001]CAP13661.1 taxis cluster protein CheD [Halobacterium salinarum R1]